jgi:hypothetical protein
MTNPEHKGVYMYPKTLLVIDNGVDRISIDRGALAGEFEQCGLSQESIMKLLSEVNSYAEEVKRGMQKNMHIGSTSLEMGVNSIFYGQDKNDPATFGLQTQTELRLAAKLIEKACQKENQERQ